MTRRKSRPLLLHEIIPRLSSSQGSMDDMLSSSFSADESSQPLPASSQTSYANSQDTCEDDKFLSAGNLNENGADVVETTKEQPMLPSEPDTSSLLAGEAAKETVIEEEQKKVLDVKDSTQTLGHGEQALPSSQNSSASLPKPRTVRRRSAPFFIHDENKQTVLQSVPASIASTKDVESSNAPTFANPLRRALSMVKLSMSLDGKAEITTQTDTPQASRNSHIPVPSHRLRRPSHGLQRSQSAVEPNSPVPACNALSFLRRSLSGRSRDARTWEFYCDSDARDALTKQAEEEQKGSAVSAISLIRSQSNKVLTPNSNKRNALPPKHDQQKRHKVDHKQVARSKLARATSSVARLQSVSGNSQKQSEHQTTKNKKAGGGFEIWESYDGDSDKENWEPGMQSSNQRRRRVGQTPAMPRPVLGDSNRVPSQSTSLDALMRRDNPSHRQSKLSAQDSVENKENSNIGEDDEVAHFMDGSSLPKESEEMDCVQGLLSLSQGAWR